MIFHALSSSAEQAFLSGILSSSRVVSVGFILILLWCRRKVERFSIVLAVVRGKARLGNAAIELLIGRVVSMLTFGLWSASWHISRSPPAGPRFATPNNWSSTSITLWGFFVRTLSIFVHALRGVQKGSLRLILLLWRHKDHPWSGNLAPAILGLDVSQRRR